MKIEIPCTEAARSLGECLERIRHTGDSFILTKNKTPVAELSPLEGGNRGTFRDLVETLRTMPADPGFADDLESVDRGDEPLGNPWS